MSTTARTPISTVHVALPAQPSAEQIANPGPPPHRAEGDNMKPARSIGKRAISQPTRTLRR